MPMILVKKNPRGKVIRELSSEEETAVKTVCGLKRPATMAQHNLANDLLREMREYDAWLQCDCIPGDSPAMNFAALKNNTGTLYLSSFNHEHAPECPMYRQLSGNEEETSFGASRHPVSTRINYRNFLPPDDSNSVIRLQARSAYHNGERSSVRKKRPRLGRLLLSLIEDAGLNKLDSLANPRIRTNYRECLDAIRQVTLQQEYIRGRALSEIIHFRPGMSERSQERLMETLENSERHWPARRKHMFFQIFMAQHICRDAVEIHWANGNIQVIRPVRGISINGEAQGGIRPPYWVLETMVEARNFIPGSQIAFGIKVIYHGNAFRRCRGATRDNQECSRNCSNDGQNAHGIFLAVFLLSVDDNRKKRERKEAQYPGPHRQLLQLFKNAPGRLDTDRVRIAFVCQHHDAKVFFWNEGYVAAKSTSGARFMHP